MGFFQSLFGGNSTPQAEQEKKFDILKYDGIRAMRIGKLTYAIKCFEEATAMREDPETMRHQANTYIRVNRLDDARKLLERMTELTPDEDEAFRSLAALCYMQEDYTAMEAACRKAIELDERNAASYFLSAKAALGMRNDLQAIAMLTKAILQDDTFAEAYQLRAEVLWNLRQPKEAYADIERLLELNPEDESALVLKAEITAADRHKEEALQTLDSVLALNPFNEKAYLLKAAILSDNGQTDEAIAVLDEALETHPDFAKGYHERGRLKLQKGDKEGSIEDMKKAMELAPENGAGINGEYHNYEQPGKNIPF